MNSGFTLIELLLVIGIIAFFSALFLPNYNSGEKQLALARSAHQLAQDLRRAQELAMSSSEILGSVPQGVGIHFISTSPSFYILFADIDGNKRRDGGEDLETITLESKVVISNLSPTNDFSIVFEPPEPVVWIDEQYAGVTAQITLALPSSPATAKIVSVNNAGLIEVGN